jgi:tetrahydromethanopterin S-methyltransferase subunit B
VDNYILEPIVPCSKCGVRYAKDLTRDGMGRRLPEEDLQDLPSPLCESCQQQEFGDAVGQDLLEFIEDKYGLTAENKKTLEALMSIIDNPDRVMMVARVQERVDELERRLEDRSNSLRDLVESKMENANSRLFVSSLITTAATFLAGVLFGIVVALVLGG